MKNSSSKTVSFISGISARLLVIPGVLLLSVSSQACEADEMIAQMRSACTELVVGYEKALGKTLTGAAAQGHLAQARSHCQALEFDKAGLKLAMAGRSANAAKAALVSYR